MQKGLTGNQLKLFAVIIMTIDHIGHIFFPGVTWLRIIGRLAYPIFAYMIAEGCTHTRSLPKYLATMAGMAAVCQVVVYLVTGSLYQYILVTFTLSILFIAILKQAMESQSTVWWLITAAALGSIWLTTQWLPTQLRGTDFSIDYSFWGVMVPVLVWLGKTKWQKLLLAAAGLVLIAGNINSIQMLSLCSLPILATYNGQRGKWKLKYFFYLYFPAHIVILEIIAYLTK